MIQRRQYFRFALKSRHALGIPSECFRQYLKRRASLQRRIERTIDLAHPSRTNGSLDFIHTKPRSGGQGHALDDSNAKMETATFSRHVIREKWGTDTFFAPRRSASTSGTLRKKGSCPHFSTKRDYRRDR
jgi:hypothetical protein